MRFTFRQNNTIIVFKIGTTTNKKLASNKEKIVQTYSYSLAQFNEALKAKTTMLDFFSKDKEVCFDCPFAVSNGAKVTACYTHRVMQYSGFLSQLRSIAKEFKTFENIPTLNNDLFTSIVEASMNKFVRFGSYGEPSLIPLNLVSCIAAVAKNWTGYSHQYYNKKEYSKFFMASTHNEAQQIAAQKIGFRSFVASKENIPTLVSCPASKESGFISNCSKCGLCSGTLGKGNKSIVIIEH